MDKRVKSRRGSPRAAGALLFSPYVPMLSIIAQLTSIKALLAAIGPTISAIMFITAGILYALGQLMPSHVKASFHTTAINVLIGAIVVAVLSVAATSFAVASTHLIGNLTNST